ncbi:DUF6875 domain-containing protein [Pedobacter aquatilis]|uniref:DUF6875 domain-containing protein n=1 Tax=Pedobacter aquatilis TaxID=351343 RepID=UPI0029308978|nr:hypothetical protein [Pedobacter aquatilis]
MNIDNAQSDIILFNLKEISSGTLPQVYKSYKDELEKFSSWVTDFLAKSNIELGRTGAVCPYVQYSREKSFFKVGIFDQINPKKDFIVNLIRNLKEVFLSMVVANEKDEKFKAITILFPNLEEDEVFDIIDGVQLLLKPEFVKEGLMIGQFHEKCEQGGLRNSHFRPLQSPVPLIAIRNMVETDWPFLEGDPVLEAAYNNNFGKINFGAQKNY